MWRSVANHFLLRLKIRGGEVKIGFLWVKHGHISDALPLVPCLLHHTCPALWQTSQYYQEVTQVVAVKMSASMLNSWVDAKSIPTILSHFHQHTMAPFTWRSWKGRFYSVLHHTSLRIDYITALSHLQPWLHPFPYHRFSALDTRASTPSGWWNFEFPNYYIWKVTSVSKV